MQAVEDGERLCPRARPPEVDVHVEAPPSVAEVEEPAGPPTGCAASDRCRSALESEAARARREAPRRRRPDVESEPLPHPTPERVHVAIRVDAFGTEEKSLRPTSCARPSPASRERVAAARPRGRSTHPVERQLHWAHERSGGLQPARERPEVRDAREHRGARTKPRHRARTTKEVDEGGVDPLARGLVRGPVERNAPRARVVTRRVRRKVTGADEEETQVPASGELDRATTAQQSIDHRFPRSHFDGAPVRGDQHHSAEPLRRGRCRQAQGEHDEESQCEVDPHASHTRVRAGEVLRTRASSAARGARGRGRSGAGGARRTGFRSPRTASRTRSSP